MGVVRSNFLLQSVQAFVAAKDIKAILCNGDPGSADFESGIANETSGTGYTAGGKAFTGVSVSLANASSPVVIDADDIAWASSTIDATHIVFVLVNGSAATNTVLAIESFGETKSSSNGTFTYQVAAGGLMQIGDDSLIGS